MHNNKSFETSTELACFAIAFASTPQLTASEKYKLIRASGCLKSLFENIQQCSSEQYIAYRWLLGRDQAKRVLDASCKHNIEITLMGDRTYPQSLYQLDKPPITLYVQGKSIPSQSKLLSVVGTRRPSSYGLRITSTLVKKVVGCGVGVVSGLAYGIDTRAHQVALEFGGYTAVVFAHGLDHTYPRQNTKLKAQILEQGGTLISEYPWGKMPLKHHFRDRNRIVAALSQGILVVEAGMKSGTRITVHEGLLLDKEIYSVPGQIDSPMSRYPNELIAQGAKPVASTNDILEDYHVKLTDEHDQESIDTHEDELGKALLAFLDVDQARSMDDFFGQTHFALPDILQKISHFEIQGWIQNQVDGRYILTKRYR